MSDDKLMEEYEERASKAFKEIHPVKLGKNMIGMVEAKTIDIGEPKLKPHINDTKIVVKEHTLTTKKEKKSKDTKKPPDLW